MADLDNDLSRRLSRLADAVPTARLDPTHLRAVEARHRVRMSWVTPLVALVVVVIGVTLLEAGNLPGATSSPSAAPSGEVVSTTQSGDFELTVRATKGRYVAGEPIEISAMLTYLGQEATVRIAHGNGSPMSFGIVEPVNGLTLSPSWRASCEQSELTRGVPLDKAFAKSGGFSGDDPRAAEWERFYAEPALMLPVGTWHPYVSAQFSSGSCSANGMGLRAEIEIEVVPGSAEASAQPTNSAVDRWRSTVRHSDFELRLEASKATFSSDEVLDVTASLVYFGPEGQISIGHAAFGPIEFTMSGSGVDLIPDGPRNCAEIDLSRGVALPMRLLALTEVQRPFGVEHGLYEIAARADFRIGGCAYQQASMAASIVVAVSDGPDDIPLFTDHSGTRACLLLRNGGRLVPSETGLGVVQFGGRAREVVWPPGYSARQAAEGAELLGSNGQVVAREGDELIFDAYDHAEGPLYPCGDVEVETNQAPAIELRTASGLHTGLCMTAIGGGTLARNPRTGLGFEDGGVVTDVIWPYGWTARLEGEEVVLYNAIGEVEAAVGDRVAYGGGHIGPEGDVFDTFAVCGGPIVSPTPK